MSTDLATPIAPSRRVERVRHEIKRRALHVQRVSAPTPGFLRLELHGESLADFASLGFDDHCKLVFEDAQGQPLMRDFTPRRLDREARVLTLEFALHDGPAADWARRAVVGTPVTIAGPRGSMVVPTDYAWHLLAGDASALPAIARRLEELPAGTHAIVRAQVPEADRRDLAASTRATLDLRWSTRDDEWLAHLAALELPPGEGFAWCAHEASVSARARAVLLGEKGHPKEAARVSAYWKRGTADFHEDL